MLLTPLARDASALGSIKVEVEVEVEATRGAQSVPIGIPTICLYNLVPNLI